MISFLTAEEVAPSYGAVPDADCAGSADSTSIGAARQTGPGSDGLIQPELALARPGVQTYVWEICGAQILIEVSECGDIRVNGKPVAPAARAG